MHAHGHESKATNVLLFAASAVNTAAGDTEASNIFGLGQTARSGHYPHYRGGALVNCTGLDM